VKQSHKFEDFKKLGFYMVLQGRCNLIFEVVKVRRLDQVDSSVESTNARLMRNIDFNDGHEEREADFEGGTL